jgi:hypothetical protein
MLEGLSLDECGDWEEINSSAAQDLFKREDLGKDVCSVDLRWGRICSR